MISSSLPVPMATATSKLMCSALFTPVRIYPITHHSRNLSVLLLGRRSNWDWNWKQRPSTLNRLVVRAARTESKAQLPLKSRAPEFELPEPLTGKVWRLDDFQGYPALLVMFICNHCPFVIHLKKDIVKLTNEYIPKGLAVVAISSNSTVTHPVDGPDFMAEEAKRFEFPFPYLYDEVDKGASFIMYLLLFYDDERSHYSNQEGNVFGGEISQEIARAFGAACTPEFFIFKKDGQDPFELAYRGQFDDSRPNNNKPITGRDLRLALDCVLSGKPVSFPQRPSVGCSIKWHPGITI